MVTKIPTFGQLLMRVFATANTAGTRCVPAVAGLRAQTYRSSTL